MAPPLRPLCNTTGRADRVSPTHVALAHRRLTRSPNRLRLGLECNNNTNYWYYLWFIDRNTYASDEALISHNFKQILGLGHLGPGEVLSNSSSSINSNSSTSTEEPQYHEPEPEPPAPILLGIEGQPIDPDEPEPPLVLDPPDASIEQPPAGIHLAIMAQVGPLSRFYLLPCPFITYSLSSIPCFIPHSILVTAIFLCATPFAHLGSRA